MGEFIEDRVADPLGPNDAVPLEDCEVLREQSRFKFGLGEDCADGRGCGVGREDRIERILN